MSEWFLRVEGVNLDSFVYDTQDLSTARSGGPKSYKSASTHCCANSRCSPTSTSFRSSRISSWDSSSTLWPASRSTSTSSSEKCSRRSRAERELR